MDQPLVVPCRLPTLAATLMLLGAIVLSGCLPIMPPPPSVQDESLTTGEPCLPPCWYGIHPGQTTLQEAIEIAKGLPFVDPASVIQNARDLPERIDQVVDWQYVGATRPTHGGVLYVRQGTIARIRIFLPRKLKLADVLVTQGKPDLVAVDVGMVGIGPMAEGLGYYLYFFYSQRGVMLSSIGYPLKEGQQYATLSPDITIEKAEYFTPTDIVGYFVEKGVTEESAKSVAWRYQPWPGLGKDLMLEPATP